MIQNRKFDKTGRQDGEALLPVEGGGVGASPQLHQFVAAVGVKEPYERPLARGRGDHASRLVERHAGDLALVRVDGERRRRRPRFGVGQILKGGSGRDVTGSQTRVTSAMFAL